MKSVSYQKPEKKFSIEKKRNGLCNVILIDNIQENTVIDHITNEETIQYEYDFYNETIQYRNNLEDSISKNFNDWIQWAKNKQKERESKKSNYEIIQDLKNNQLDMVEINVDQETRLTMMELGIKESDI